VVGAGGGREKYFRIVTKCFVILLHIHLTVNDMKKVS
jgi:hypothetical protein